jgi:hypothetical protein
MYSVSQFSDIISKNYNLEIHVMKLQFWWLQFIWMFQDRRTTN